MTASERIKRWRESPAAMVRELFETEPDAWQLDVLEMFPTSPRQAMKACKGPGKTAVLAWLSWNFLLCYLHPKMAAVSISGDNLRDGLWTEMAKWQARSPLLKAAFTWTASRIFANDHPETWFMSFRTWQRGASKDQQANTLAGLHADNLMFVLDEAGGIPDAVMAAAEAGLANADPSKGKHAHILMAGNPTHLEGPLYRACSAEAHLWHVVEVTADPDDPKRSPRVSKEWAQQQIEKYGRDNPWVLVNVFGRFPPSSLNALLGPDEVREAMGRHYNPESYEHEAKVLGVDVSLYGDDASIIFKRQGCISLPVIEMRGIGPVQGAGAVAREWKDWGADGCFIDGTGGFGDPWAVQMEGMGLNPVRVLFSGKADSTRYANKRAEMHFRLAEWVRNGGALPKDDLLLAELTATTYGFKGDALLLEPKEQVKAKLGRSPDRADALSLTFAYPVHRRQQDVPEFLRHLMDRAETHYDPLEGF